MRNGRIRMIFFYKDLYNHYFIDDNYVRETEGITEYYDTDQWVVLEGTEILCRSKEEFKEEIELAKESSEIVLRAGLKEVFKIAKKKELILERAYEQWEAMKE